MTKKEAFAASSAVKIVLFIIQFGFCWMLLCGDDGFDGHFFLSMELVVLLWSFLSAKESAQKYTQKKQEKP